ncbi:hypothetical protein BGZ95_006703 [Linnemannia exigua]|uniref:Uncharacterized protein n=1 Tax=Linnemannia exigua TaxID=604196 RepID=A0AAD4H858_9FUNG|nr:hypothetical protein BGZ95_006703 [Linnemannia exigua]
MGPRFISLYTSGSAWWGVVATMVVFRRALYGITSTTCRQRWHPRKCKWDSIPNGRVKDDKDRRERNRKSKRLWSHKYRLRRRVEEAALVLSMLYQAV